MPLRRSAAAIDSCDFSVIATVLLAPKSSLRTSASDAEQSEAYVSSADCFGQYGIELTQLATNLGERLSDVQEQIDERLISNRPPAELT